MPEIKQLPFSNRPRERLMASGPNMLTDAELVALIFGGSLQVAHEVVARIGGAHAIRRAVLGELRDVPGVGVGRACQLQAAMELGGRSRGSDGDRGLPLHTPPHAFAHLRHMMRLDAEELHVLALDARRRLLASFCIARGAENIVHCSPRDLYRRLLREGAVATVIAHNHPTGSPVPSPSDIDLTQRLRSAGELVGIALLDHLIIAPESYFTFKGGRILNEHSPVDAAGVSYR